MFRTAKRVCTGKKAEGIPQNGYRLQEPRKFRAGRILYIENGSGPFSKIPFLVPLIPDEVSTSNRKRLRRSGLGSATVVYLPPSNLKQQLIQNRLHNRFCLFVWSAEQK